MSIQVKRLFKPRLFVFSVWGLVCGLVLGVAGTVEAQTAFVAPISKSYATYGNFSNNDYIDVQSDCNHGSGLFAPPLIYAGTIEITESANQNSAIGPWMEITHPGWSCRRTFWYHSAYFPPTPLPECAAYPNDPDNPTDTHCYPQVSTRTRHWLTGIIPASFVYVQELAVDGDMYSVYRGSDWTGSHNLAGLGFVVKWEAVVTGTPVVLPVNFKATGEFYTRGPTVEVVWENQLGLYGSPIGSNYDVTDAKLSFRMILLAEGAESIKNSDGNIFVVTRRLNLGADNCQPDPNKPNCNAGSIATNQAIDVQANLNIRHQNPTCTAENLTVPMGSIPLTLFLTANAVGGETFFEIKLTCPRVIRRNVDYSLSASSGTSPNPNLGLVPLASSSTATGVDVQILDASKIALELDTFHSAYTWAPGHTPVSEVKVPLYAQLRRKGNDTVTPGAYTAAATVLIQYQ